MASQPHRPNRPVPSFRRGRPSRTLNLSLGDELDYQALGPDMTRLVILKRSQPDDLDVHVDVIQVPFSELGKDAYVYEALSYHWGAGEPTNAVILCNELTYCSGTRSHPAAADITPRLLQDKKFFIKPNLYQALLHLRDPDLDIKIWVDAICINQNKQDEKETQVKRLPEIYSKATRVLIWLGPGDQSTKRAMSFVGELLDDLVGVETLILDQSKVHFWQDLMHLIRSSWFSRRWVIQELALAQDATVHCGADALHWIDLRDAISIFSDNFDAIRPLFKRSNDFDNDYDAIGDIESLPAKVLIEATNNIFKTHRSRKLYQREPLQGLEYLVSTLSAFDTTDPRDTINAFRSIAKETYGKQESSRPPPPPNYTENLLHVYRQFVKWVVETSGSIDILCRRWAIPEREKKMARYPALVKLPSWIQTIDRVDRTDEVLGSRRHGDSFVGIPGRSPYTASHTQKAKVYFGKHRLGSPHQEALGGQGMTTADAPMLVPEARAGASQVWDDNRRYARSPELVVTEPTPVLPKIVTLDTNGTPVATRQPQSPKLNNKRKHEGSAQTDSNLLGTTTEPPSKRPQLDLLSTPLFEPARPRRRSTASDLGSPSSPTPRGSFDDFAAPKSLIGNMDASIFVEGLIIGSLVWVTNPTTDGVVPAAALDRLQPSPPRDGNIPDKVWRTLSAERGSDGGQPPVTYVRACQYVWDKLTPNNHINTKELLTKMQPSIVRNFLKRVQAVVWDRCFLEVEPCGAIRGQDKMKMHGFGPSMVKQGDVLCVLFGCSVPCVLREFEDPESGAAYYRFVGEAYVYGVMDGEAVSWRKQEDIDRDKRVFRIL